MAARRYAVLDGEDVVNVILLDTADEYEPDDGLGRRLAPAEAGIGWKYINKKWVSPPLPEEPDMSWVTEQ